MNPALTKSPPAPAFHPPLPPLPNFLPHCEAGPSTPDIVPGAVHGGEDVLADPAALAPPRQAVRPELHARLLRQRHHQLRPVPAALRLHSSPRSKPHPHSRQVHPNSHHRCKTIRLQRFRSIAPLDHTHHINIVSRQNYVSRRDSSHTRDMSRIISTSLFSAFFSLSRKAWSQYLHTTYVLKNEGAMRVS